MSCYFIIVFLVFKTKMQPAELTDDEWVALEEAVLSSQNEEVEDKLPPIDHELYKNQMWSRILSLQDI